MKSEEWIVKSEEWSQWILGSGYESAKNSSYNRHERQETRQRGKKGKKTIYENKLKYEIPEAVFKDKDNWKTGDFYYETGVKTIWDVKVFSYICALKINVLWNYLKDKAS